MIRPRPIELAVAIEASSQPWYMCKWFESVDESEVPGRYLGSDSPLTLFETAELAFIDDTVLASAPYGVFFSDLHPSGLVVEIAKFPAHLKIINTQTKSKTVLGRIRQVFGL